MDKKIVIIGGGFAGINLAKSLGNVKGFDVTLVDKNNYNFFTPLLYQVSTGMLDVSSITIPFRTLFKGKDNLNYRLGKLKEINTEAKKVLLSSCELDYDYLVMANGTKSNFFGMKNIEENALPMKSINQAVKLRNYLLREAERFINSNDEAEKRKMSNIVISGAGPSGVEVAGMLAEMRNSILNDIYPEFRNQKMDIYLVDGSPSVLPPMSEKSQKYSKKSLEEMGIHVKLNKLVSDYKDDKVIFDDGDTIETKTLIWTAGVTGMQFKGLPEDSYDKGNRLMVDEHFKVKNTDNIYAIGDASVMKSDPDFPEGHPQLASVATQQGKLLAENFKAIANNEKPKAFIYSDKGTMAIIGKNKAVADLTTPEKTITGWFAWFTWLFIHLFLLINYRNRISTMWNWTTAYFSKGQANGLIIGKTAEGSMPELKKQTEV